VRLNLICAVAAAGKSRGFDIHLCERNYSGINNVLSLLRLVVPPFLKLHYVHKGTESFRCPLKFCLICSCDYQLAHWPHVFSLYTPSLIALLLCSLHFQTLLFYSNYLLISVNNLLGERPLGRPKRRWNDNIQIDLMFRGVDSFVSGRHY
jgi:hypothetical protein